ncbi:MAG: CDP-alcohol phosphatidyltransferase family protein [Ignavibacteriales bacterium]
MINIKEIYTKSNLLSLLRLFISIPVYFLLFKFEKSYTYKSVILGLLLAACITDFLDGYIARKYHEITELGKIVDPLADKVLVGVVVLQLFFMGKIPAFYFYSVIGRDIVIFLGGIFVTKRIGKVLPSNLLGKITVTLIASYILAVILQLDSSIPAIYYALLYISLIFVFVSLIGYIIRAKESLTWNKNESVQEH